MPKFFLEQVSTAKRKPVFDILSNFKNYQKLLPQHFPSIRIRSVRETTSVVEEHIILGGKELVIMAKHVIDEPWLHEIFVIGGDAKGSYIKQQILDHSKGCKILVDVDLKLPGMMKLSGLFNTAKFKENYAKILDDFIKIAEN